MTTREPSPFTAQSVADLLARAAVFVSVDRAEEIAQTANAFTPLLSQVWSVDTAALADTPPLIAPPWLGETS